MSKVIKGTRTLGERVARTFLWLFTGAIPVFIAACYGPAEGYGPDGSWENEVAARGKVLNGLTLEPISDIKISCVRSGYVYDATYSLPGDGSFQLWYVDGQPCDTLLAEDVDGDENGAFISTEIPFNPGDETAIIELESEPTDAN